MRTRTLVPSLRQTRVRGTLLALFAALLLALPARAQYVFTRIADTSGPFQSFLGDSIAYYPSLSAGGAVTFYATRTAGGAGIFLGEGGPVVTIADTNGPFSEFGTPSVNLRDTVAFQGTLVGGEKGVFVGNGGATVNGRCIFALTASESFPLET